MSKNNNHRRMDGTIGLNDFRIVIKDYDSFKTVVGQATTLKVIKELEENFHETPDGFDQETYIEQAREHENGQCHWEALDEDESPRTVFRFLGHRRRF